MPHASRSDTSFTVVQALRGIAALWVVLFHAGEGAGLVALKAALPGPLTAAIFDAGHFGVAMFFALSGFVIAHSLRDPPPEWRFIGRFALRRSLRLDPPYWASIVLVVAMAWLSAHAKHVGFVAPRPGTVAAHLLYLQILLRSPAINTVYWTLTYEIQFYLFFATSLVTAKKLCRRTAWAWPATWAAMTGLALAAALGLFSGVRDGLFVELWSSFFVGVLGYRAPRSVAAAIATALLVGCMALGPAATGFSRISGGTAVLLAISLRRGWIKTWLNWRGLQFLGAISYSLYLVHNPLTGATSFLMRKALGQGLAASMATLVAVLIASIGGAAAFWQLIERPAHRWSRRVSTRSGGAHPPTAASVAGPAPPDLRSAQS